jgi:hypothetical protein
MLLLTHPGVHGSNSIRQGDTNLDSYLLVQPGLTEISSSSQDHFLKQAVMSPTYIKAEVWMQKTLT